MRVHVTAGTDDGTENRSACESQGQRVAVGLRLHVPAEDRLAVGMWMQVSAHSRDAVDMLVQEPAEG